jgi:hypothetical protein
MSTCFYLHCLLCFYQAWVNYINKLKIYFILQYSLICDEKYIHMHIVSLKYENILYISWI